MVQLSESNAMRGDRAGAAALETLELVRCAVQLLTWKTSEPDDQMLAEAALRTLDEAMLRLER